MLSGPLYRIGRELGVLIVLHRRTAGPARRARIVDARRLLTRSGQDFAAAVTRGLWSITGDAESVGAHGTRTSTSGSRVPLPPILKLSKSQRKLRSAKVRCHAGVT
jgi:hypothetical protein